MMYTFKDLKRYKYFEDNCDKGEMGKIVYYKL